MSAWAWDEWEAPEGYVDVKSVTPAWEQEGALVIFWIGRELEGANIRKAFSQRCAVSSTGQLTPDPEVNVIATLDARPNWTIAHVQRAPDGHFGVSLEWISVSSA